MYEALIIYLTGSALAVLIAVYYHHDDYGVPPSIYEIVQIALYSWLIAILAVFSRRIVPILLLISLFTGALASYLIFN